MSIVDNHAAINQAIHALQPDKAVRNNGRYLCRECYGYLGELSVGDVVSCPNCNAINRVVE